MQSDDIMRIFVDADGCPVVDIAIKVAKSYGLEIVVVKNYHMNWLMITPL